MRKYKKVKNAFSALKGYQIRDDFDRKLMLGMFEKLPQEERAYLYGGSRNRS